MNIKTKQEIIRDWEKDNFDKFYLFSGEEYFLKLDLIEYLKKKFSSNLFDFAVFSGDEIDIDTFISDCQIAPVSFKKRIVILKRAHKLKTDAIKKIIDYLKKNLETLSILLFYDKAFNSKDSLYEEFINLKGVLCEFNPLDLPSLKKYVMDRFFLQGKLISEENVELLLEITNNNIALISSEIEKLILYAKEKKEITDKDILQSAGGIKEENPFKIINFILERDIDNLIKLVEELLKEKNEPLWIISLFLNALDKMLKILRVEKSGLWYNPKILYELGLYKNDSFKAKKIINISEEKIISLIEKCLDAEHLLKTSSERNPEILIRNLVYQIKLVLKK